VDALDARRHLTRSLHEEVELVVTRSGAPLRGGQPPSSSALVG